MLGALAQYQIMDVPYLGNSEPRLQLIGSHVAIYMKNLDSYTDVRPRTINFGTYKTKIPSDGVYLVLPSMTFNIVETRMNDVYVLCAENFPTHRFFLYFNHLKAHKNFLANSSFETIINRRIPCSTAWLTVEMLKNVYTLAANR